MKKTVYILFLMVIVMACTEGKALKSLDEIDSLIQRDQYDSAYTALQEIKESQLKSQEEYVFYWLLRIQGCILVHQPDSLQMLDHLIIPYYTEKANHRGLAEAYYYKAYECLVKGNLSEATNFYKEAETQAEFTTDQRLRYKIAVGLEYLNEISGNHLLQMEYARKMLKIAQDVKNRGWIGCSYNRIAVAYSRLGEADRAIQYMGRAVPYIKDIPKKNLPAFINNVAFIYKHSQPALAKKYLEEALAMDENSNTLQHLADIYYEEGNHEKAYTLWKRALSLNNGIDRDNILYNILAYDVEHGQADCVCEKVDEIIEIKDSILNQLKNDTIKDLQLRFDHEVAMNKQKHEINRLKIWGLIVALIVLIMAAYIAIRHFIDINRKQAVQMQISDYVSQIRELKASGNETQEKIDQLNHQIKELMDDKAPDLKMGRLYYDDLKEGKVKTLSLAGWKKKEEQLFIDYYAAIDFRTVSRLRNAKRKEKLTTHRLFYLLLIELGKSDEEICILLGINKKNLAVLKTRTQTV